MKHLMCLGGRKPWWISPCILQNSHSAIGGTVTPNSYVKLLKIR